MSTVIAGWGHPTPEAQHMSLRDYFAAQALVAFSHPEMIRSVNAEADRQQLDSVATLVMAAYHIADAMLTERAK